MAPNCFLGCGCGSGEVQKCDDACGECTIQRAGGSAAAKSRGMGFAEQAFRAKRAAAAGMCFAWPLFAREAFAKPREAFGERAATAAVITLRSPG